MADELDTAIERVLQGDDQAFELIVRRYQKSLFAYMSRMGLAADVVEDLAQETFVRAYQHLSGFNPHRAAFSTWLFSIARHLCFAELRRQARQRPLDDGEIERIACAAGSPEREIDEWRLRTAVHRALRGLSLDDRGALALAYVSELSGREAAQVLGCSQASYRTRLHRARQKLKLLLEREPDHGGD